jgi:hypothetical protein
VAQRITGNADSPYGHYWKGPQFSNYVQYIKKNDGYAYHIVAQTDRHYCEFRLLVDATAGDRAETVTVDDGGRPFRVSGEPPNNSDPRLTDFEGLYVAGEAAPSNRDATYKWFAEDPKTYRGGEA